MDNFNKVVSFILGLVVVILILVIITGRLRITNRIASLTRGNAAVSPTPIKIPGVNAPTPIVRPSFTPTPTRRIQGNGATTQNIKEIPDTGAPTFILPAILLVMAAGVGLRKKS